MQIPSHKDYQEFAWEVHASFEVPAACNWAKKVKNHYTPPPAHFSVMKHCFLLPMKEEFATQDIHLAQSQNTIAYMRALQYWAELVHPPVPSQPCSLLENICKNFQQVMELLSSFGEEEVFVTIAPSNWMEVAPPQSLETTPQPPLETQKSPKPSTQAHLRGPITMTQSEGQHTFIVKQTAATKEALATTSCQFLTDSRLPCLPPGFTKIVQTLKGITPAEQPYTSDHQCPSPKDCWALWSHGDGCYSDQGINMPNHWGDDDPGVLRRDCGSWGLILHGMGL